MELNSAILKLQKCLDVGSSHQQDIMFVSLRNLLHSKDALLDSEQTANFILTSRQVLEYRCKAKAEEVLFYLFQKIDPLERCQFVNEINKKINQLAGFSPSTISRVMLLNGPHAISSEEFLHLEEDREFELLCDIVKRMDPYVDVELTADEVKQVFTKLAEFISKIKSPSQALIIFFNDFLIRSSLNQSYSWEAD